MGKVTIKAATSVCIITLSGGKGTCKLAARQLAPGTYHLTAGYAGTASFAASTSAAKTLTVTGQRSAIPASPRAISLVRRGLGTSKGPAGQLLLAGGGRVACHASPARVAAEMCATGKACGLIVGPVNGSGFDGHRQAP